MSATTIPPDMADWLLTQYAVGVIDAIKNPSTSGDDIIRTLSNLPPQWHQLLRERINQLPR